VYGLAGLETSLLCSRHRKWLCRCPAGSARLAAWLISRSISERSLPRSWSRAAARRWLSSFASSLEVTDGLWELVPVVAASELHEQGSSAQVADSSATARVLTAASSSGTWATPSAKP
jgi:hypothetical protein